GCGGSGGGVAARTCRPVSRVVLVGDGPWGIPVLCVLRSVPEIIVPHVPESVVLVSRRAVPAASPGPRAPGVVRALVVAWAVAVVGRANVYGAAFRQPG